MGQYYLPKNLTNGEWLYAHEYNNGLKLMEHSFIDNDFVKTVESLLMPNGRWHKAKIVWAGDYADNESETKENLYDTCIDNNLISPNINEAKDHFFIVNHTKKEFVDKRKVTADKNGWQIHPLPLLTCEGNGRGGGDFRGEDPKNLIGNWARDSISVEIEAPEDFNELIFDLNE